MLQIVHFFINRPLSPLNYILQLVSLVAQEIKRNTKESFMSVLLC